MSVKKVDSKDRYCARQGLCELLFQVKRYFISQAVKDLQLLLLLKNIDLVSFTINV